MSPGVVPSRHTALHGRGVWLAACVAGLLVSLALAVVGPSTEPRPPRQDQQERPPRDLLLDRARGRIAAAEAAHGPDSPEVADALAGAAQLLWGLEEYATARPLADRALAIRTAMPGESSELAASLYQVGELCRATGDYACALRSHRRAVAIWERTRGRDDTEVAAALHYLGVVHSVTGDMVAARACLERALAIRERRLGAGNEQVAPTLAALAGVEAQAGDRGAAMALYERAQAIWERTLGPTHPFVARTLGSRAALLAGEGDRDGARRLLDRALALRIEAYGPEHYLVARSQVDLADLLASSGDDDAAERMYRRALELQRRTLGPDHPDVASTLAALARVQWADGERPAAVAAALEAEAIARGFFRQSARDLTDGEALQYGSVRTTGLDVALTALVSFAAGAPATLETPGIRDIADEIIRSRAIVLDGVTRGRAVAAGGASPRHGESGAVEPGFREVLEGLPADSALVAFHRFMRVGPLSVAPKEEYLAVVMRRGIDLPVAVPLGSAADIDALVESWRDAVSSDPRARPAAAEERAGVAGTRLRAAIWDPLAAAVAGASQVFLVPDGAIGLVSFATLPAGAGRSLLEDGPLLHYLVAERDILRGSPQAGPGEGILIVGGPDFDAPPAAGAAEAARAATDDPGSGARPLCREFAGRTFEPLPAAAAEADEIAARWGGGTSMQRLTGAAATETGFRERAPGRRILHLATHAYFLPAACGATRGWPPEDRTLLRSGLALAGANRRDEAEGWSGGADGILTAEEIAALDLSGVEWAVLSACDTGAGQVFAGEGVVGLRRAFERAGVGTVIMSLWAVDDGAARFFMRALYAGRLSGLSTAASMRRAGLEMIAAQRARGRTTHPYFWGGFVAAGDWR